MDEVCISLNKNSELIDTGMLCTLNKSQCITIPKKIRRLLSLKAGDEVTISLTNISKGMIVQKYTCETLENIMVVTNSGSIRIPKEFMKVLSLKIGDMFHIYRSFDEQFIILIQVSE